MTAADKKKLDGVAAGATANDTMYKNQTPSTVAVGGIPAGYVPPTEGIDVVDVVDKLLHAYVAPKATASMVPENGGVCEIGTQKSVTAVTVNLTLGSAAIKKIGEFDLILAGRQAIDGDTAQVGPQIAEKLHLPQVTYVEEFNIDDNMKDITVKRQLEDGYEIIKIQTLLNELTI